MKTSATFILALSAFVAQIGVVATRSIAAEIKSEVLHGAANSSQLDGNWIWITPGRNGAPDRENILSLKVSGATLTGKISAPGRDGKAVDVPIIEGKIEGSTVSFAVQRGTNANAVPVRYSGTLSDGALTGTVVTTRNGEAQSAVWTAKNAGARAVAGSVEVPAPKPGYDANGNKTLNETKYKEITVAAAEKLLEEHPDTLILDLRSPAEFATGHLPNALNYNVTDLETYKDVLAKLDKNKRYLINSNSGGYRTIRAFEYFEANGFAHVSGLEGGVKAWSAAGKPVVK